MFTYLSKKIAIPNGVQLRSLSWNPEHGWIACGGDEGLLKVLKLESTSPKEKNASSTLSMNQTLEGHQGAVVCVAWNAAYRKLTTSDENGLIIVWTLYEGTWFEEMINNRNKSVVRAMRWTAQGQNICIVYEDGAVIVGSVGGDRLWGKELSEGLADVEWSPDAKNVLFLTLPRHELHMYDVEGNKVKEIGVAKEARRPKKKKTQRLGNANDDGDDDEDLEGNPPVVSLDWYDGVEGYADPSAPTLAVAFRNGKVQLMRGADDGNPIVFDSELTSLSRCAWNSRGTTLAIAGTMSSGAANDNSKSAREVSLVQFYTPYGAKLRSTKVPGGGIHGLSWEGGGLRIALAVDSSIYFANVRPDVDWGLFSSAASRTLACSFAPQDRAGSALLFWNLASGEKRKLRAPLNLKAIKAAGEHCVVISGGASADSSSSSYVVPKDNAVAGNLERRRRPCEISLRNAIGATVETREVPIEPVFAAMTPHYVAVASERYAYVWQYARANFGPGPSRKDDEMASDLLSLRESTGRERVLDVEAVDPNRPEAAVSMIENFKVDDDNDNLVVADPIVAISASDRMLLLARASGTILRFSLPHVTLEKTYDSSIIPRKMVANCDDTRLAVIDKNGVLNLMVLGDCDDSALETNNLDQNEAQRKKNKNKNAPLPQKGGEGPGSRKSASSAFLRFERKDAWDVLWAEDDPHLFAAMEKTRLYCYGKSLEAEEPVVCPGFLAQFKNLEVTSVVVEDVVRDAETVSFNDVVVTNELSILRQLRETMLGGGGFAEANAFVEAKTTKDESPALWRRFADFALEELDLGFADKAFVKCKDYRGIQFVKKLRTLASDRMKQKAEVAAFFGRFDEADQIYRDIDRADLAVHLRSNLGDWQRVASLVQSNSSAGDDELLAGAYRKLGEQCALAAKYEEAKDYYEKAQDADALADCYYRLNDFEALEKLLATVPNANAPLLLNLAEKFEAVGLHTPAVDAYLRAGERKRAVDCCILLHQWETAVEIAEEFGFQQIEGLLLKNANELLQSKNKELLAVELYRKANKATAAAKLLVQIAERIGVQQCNPLRAKKLLVLAALEVERYRKKTLDVTMAANRTNKASIAQATAATLNTLMTHDQESGTSGAKVLDNAWRGAAAYHYYLLAHRQLYAGHMDAAKLTAIRVSEYEDVITKKDIYSLVALCALHAEDYNVCSKAFIKLETLDDNTEEDKAAYEKMAFAIFVKHPPNDDAITIDPCYIECLDMGKSYHACTVTGRACLRNRTLMCPTCRHHALEVELRDATHCPLCHASYPPSVLGL